MSLFCCPICGCSLTRSEKAYVCPGGHNYDRAKEGYVHLLPANRMHSKTPGDDKDMAAARNRFLSGGYYAPLRDALCALALEHTGGNPAPAVLDAGCGEGYYTSGLYEALSQAGKQPRLAGVDLSKPSVRYAAKRVNPAELAIATVYRLPVEERCIDLLLDCFSPLALEEFRRVLRPDGVFLYVVPAARHLWELKQVLYDQPYLNPEENVPYEGFEALGVTQVQARFTLAGRQAIQDLFRMTPYYWKTPKEGTNRLAALDTLTVTAAFRIHAFRRI